MKQPKYHPLEINKEIDASKEIIKAWQKAIDEHVIEVAMKAYNGKP